MKVAYVCADAGIPVFGQKGSSIHVQEIIRSLLNKKAQVSLFTTRLGGEIPLEFEPVKIYQLPSIPKVETAIREKVAYSINPDLEIELTLAQPFDLVYERYSLWSYSGMEYAQKNGIPSILEVNAPLILEQEQHRGLINHSQAEKVAHRVFNSATYIIAVSQPIKDYVSQYVTDKDKIKVIPNGVNAQRFSHSMSENKIDHDFTVGFVGTLKPWHGLSVLMESFAKFYRRCPQSRLLIVGDGKQRDFLNQQIGEHHLESAVVLTGAVAPDMIPYYLSQMDVAVAPYPPSNNFYFSPLKVYEYMAAGLPVIASNIGQISQIIDDEVNGLLCPVGDVTALVRALERLWRSPALRSQLGNSARQKILTNHTWKQVTQQILSLIEPQTVTSTAGRK